MTVAVEPEAKRRLGVVHTVVLGPLAAVRVDDPGRLLPLRRACGAYVDWYQLRRPASEHQ